MFRRVVVTPRAGVWIEIRETFKKKKEVLVTPRAGVWIEIHHGMRGVVYKWASLPVRECGLK